MIDQVSVNGKSIRDGAVKHIYKTETITCLFHNTDKVRNNLEQIQWMRL